MNTCRVLFLVWLAIFPLCCNVFAGENGKALDVYSQMNELSVYNIVQLLRKQSNIRLNFEDLEFTKNDEIRLGVFLQGVKSKNADNLSSRERHLLEVTRILREHGANEDTIIDYVQPLIKYSDIADKLAAPEQLLEQVVKLAPQYSLLKSNGSYILYCNKNIYPKISHFHIDNVTPKEAYEALREKILKDVNINLVSRGPLPYVFDKNIKISIDLQNTDLLTLFTRFSGSSGKFLR